jgi:alpha-amylase
MIYEINFPDHFAGTEESDCLESLLGNELQQESLEKLYGIKYRINQEYYPDLWKDWQYLQSSDHFYYMSSRFFSNGHTDLRFNPYENPYEAFINYMNVLSDFTRRLFNLPPREILYEKQDTKSEFAVVAAS